MMIKKLNTCQKGLVPSTRLCAAVHVPTHINRRPARVVCEAAASPSPATPKPGFAPTQVSCAVRYFICNGCRELSVFKCLVLALALACDFHKGILNMLKEERFQLVNYYVFESTDNGSL